MNPSLTLMPFQEAGASRIAITSRGYLVWEPGVGKTPTTVRACVKASARRILVFCPPIAVGVWRDHFTDWSNYQDIRVADTIQAFKPLIFMAGNGVRIVPYSRCRPNSALLLAARAKVEGVWDTVILDEAHYLKTSHSQRTRAVYGSMIDLKGTPLEYAKRIWVLTGTPILNHPAEFWTHLRALSPEVLYFNSQMPVVSEDFFTQRYCVTRPTPYGVQILGGRNTNELAQRIRPLIDRKRLKDVIDDMPDLRIVEHVLPDTGLDPTLRQELDAILEQLKHFGQNVEHLDDDELLALVQTNLSFSTMRRLVGRAKVEGVAMMAHDFLDDNVEAKLIIFCHHREVIRDLSDKLKRHAPLVIHGGTPGNVRENSIATFQTDPRFRLIILAIDTAGEAITLHASHNVILMEPSPVPARNHQAINRAYRQGQKNHVLARFVILPGFLDARITSIIARKTRDIAKVVDGVNLDQPELSTQDEARLAFPDNV